MTTSEAPRFHGFVVIDKPAGWTSHDVVGRVRRLLGQRKVGHAGTLDPAATGVLPVAVGDATRVLSFMPDTDKAYRAEITFGVGTDTDDADGRLTAIDEPTAIERTTLESVLAGFVGTIVQQVPKYSAVQQQGRRLYELARRGTEFEPPSRTVRIDALELVALDGPRATVDVGCQAGTYVRALARDIGRAMGTVAHLSDLLRIRSGPFTLCDAWRLDDLASLPLDACWEMVALHPDAALLQHPAIVLDALAARAWSHGEAHPVRETTPSGTVRVYDSQGQWVGVGEVLSTRPPLLRPRRVIEPASPLDLGRAR